MSNAISFLAGAFIGAFIAIFTVSLCIAAKRGDRQ